MAQVLSEYFGAVRASDVFDYGYGEVQDFLNGLSGVQSVDWIVTNPPFRLAEDFFERASQIARKGVALLTRTVFIESVGRYERVFNRTPPSVVLQYAERVPMVKGRVDRKASTATGYAWLVWSFDGVPTQMNGSSQISSPSLVIVHPIRYPALPTICAAEAEPAKPNASPHPSPNTNLRMVLPCHSLAPSYSKLSAQNSGGELGKVRLAEFPYLFSTAMNYSAACRL
jgi:hypothetical protein